MSLIGSVGPYEESEKFSTYVDRVKLFFSANAVKEDKQVPAFLSLIGPKIYGLVKDLVSPKSPKDCTFDELVKTLESHYKPQVLVIYERFKFYKRVQENHENVSTFVAALKSLAATCDFGSQLEEMLRDKLVMGLKEESTQRVLLTEKQLTFSRAVEIAVAREAADKDVREFGQKSNANNREVHSVKTTNKSYSFPKKKSNLGGREKEKVKKPEKPCQGCGKGHWKSDCPFKDAECYLCKRTGHISKMCYSKNKPNTSNFKSKSKSVSSVEARSAGNYGPRENVLPNKDSSLLKSGEYIFTNESGRDCPMDCNDDSYYVTLNLNNCSEVKFQVDTGAARTLMSEQEFYRSFPKYTPQLFPTKTELKKYGGSKIPVCGEIRVKVNFQGQELEDDQTIVIVKDTGPNLLGRDLLPALQISLNLANSSSVNVIADKSVVSRFPEVFKEDLGTFKGLEVSFDMEESVSPKFCKARNVPYAMRAKVDAALDKLLEQEIIQSVTHSNWAAPIVPVLKNDGTIRICGDYRLTINQATKTTAYPVPRIDDLFATIGGGKIFSKLDMSNAYNQIVLSPEARSLTTINTHRGLFQYNRLCFGIASAPGIFQRAVEELLRGIPGVCVFLDDILVSGSSPGEHDKRLGEVLKRFQEVGLRLHPTKCSFGVDSVQYLGYTIDATGLKPMKEKLEAIVNAPEPKDLTQLRSYLGMLNFYRKFLVNAAVVLEPLNSLLRKDVCWKWNAEHSRAFQKSKSMLIDACLIRFDPNLPIVVSADSSRYGVGAVLCQKKNGDELPVVFASRTLNKAERNYSQTEKEALALIFALKKFHHYLWGQSFSLVTDHKPLLGLFNPNKPIPEMSSGRIQRWSLMLQAYSFDLYHRSGKSLGTADALSRLPLTNAPESVPVCAEWIQLVNTLDATPVTANDISKWSKTDSVIARVLFFLDSGWPEVEVEPELKPYFHRRNELSVQQGCVLWGHRVIIPSKGRGKMLDELHQEHLGSTKMKQLARAYFWWPNLDKDIEDLSASCSVCLASRDVPKKAPLHPWDWPEKPWVRVHADYAGPVMNTYFLVLTDAHSKWVEVLPTKDTSSFATINLVRNVFAHFGLPLTLVTDNGPNFVSSEFELFLEKNGVRHITSAPYQPSTNGQAENSVKSLKSFLKNCSGNDWRMKLDRFLFQYRVTPHSTTNVSPAELMFGRKLRTVFDLVHPKHNVKNNVLSKQETQKSNYDSTIARGFQLNPESPVMVRNYSTISKDKWIPAKVVKQTGPVSYKCELEGGNIVRRHTNQMLTRSPNLIPTTPIKTREMPLAHSPIVPEFNEGAEGNTEVEAPPRQATPVRRSTRVAKPPDRLDL